MWPFLVFSPKVLTCQQSHEDLTGFLPQPGSGPEEWRLFAIGTKQSQHPARPEDVCLPASSRVDRSFSRKEKSKPKHIVQAEKMCVVWTPYWASRGLLVRPEYV